MLIRKTDYYEQFICSANRCQDTCCGRWKIGIDEETMKRYEKMEGVFANRLHNSIDKEDATFLQYEGKCIFLDEEQLCDIHKEVGEDYLCHTCKTYPRHMEEYPGTREFSLSLSCPEVANMILSNQEKAYWVMTQEDDGDDGLKDELLAILVKARTVTLLILQMREMPIGIRLSLVLAMSHDMQRRLNLGDYEGMMKVMKRYQNPSVMSFTKAKVKSYAGRNNELRRVKRKFVRQLMKLQTIQPKWKADVKAAHKMIGSFSKEKYLYAYDKYKSYMRRVDYDVMLEQLACYFVMTYYNTAYYDGELYAKMKFVAYSVLMIQELSFIKWIQNRTAAPFDLIMESSYEYGREIEHQDKNLDLLDQIFAKKDKYCLEEFLIALS